MATKQVDHLLSLVGGNIAAARRAAGLTQQELATALGTSISRVSGWETGAHMPSRRQQPALADLLFGGNVSALFTEPEDSGVPA